MSRMDDYAAASCNGVPLVDPEGHRWVQPSSKACTRCDCCTARLCALAVPAHRLCSDVVDRAPDMMSVDGCPCTVRTYLVLKVADAAAFAIALRGVANTRRAGMVVPNSHDPADGTIAVQVTGDAEELEFQLRNGISFERVESITYDELFDRLRDLTPAARPETGTS